MCDHDHDPRPSVAGTFLVSRSTRLADAVCRLDLARGAAGEPRSLPTPRSGQFFMLRARPSSVLLGRPISVYRSDDSSISFLILNKGKGTAELCALRPGSPVDLVGPIGNSFPHPSSYVVDGAALGAALCAAQSATQSATPRVALLGGGIGVAPVAGFALDLEPLSFDFYASFRTSPYGLDGLDTRARRLVITTEDGSVGVKGMLPDVFKAESYDLIYACGPTPMLRYVKEAASGRPYVFLSLEERMACGAGACLGCTVRTLHGNKRCCVDGPVFDAKEVIL